MLIFSPVAMGQTRGYKSTPSGLEYKTTHKVKKAAKPQHLCTVQVLYTMSLADGTPVAAASDTANPLEFVFGGGDVIPGWQEAVGLMRIGEKAQFILPPNLAYGDKKVGKIPASSIIHLQVELLGAYPTFFSQTLDSYTANPSGLKYRIHNKKPAADKVTKGNYVLIQYCGYTIDANGKRTVFDDSRKKDSPSLVQVGVGKFFAGLDEGLLLASVGDSISLIIPPHLGYGQKANQLVPANSTIGFDIFVEAQLNPFQNKPDDMMAMNGYQYGFVHQAGNPKAQINDMVTIELLGYYYLADGTPFIFESSFERQDDQTLRIGRAIENPAWLHVLQQCGVGDVVHMVLEPDMARTELKKLIPENVSVIFDFTVTKISPPSYINTDSITPLTVVPGLQVFTAVLGNGPPADTNAYALVHYTGYTIDSTGKKNVFDSSFDRAEPFKVRIGKGEVIKGWDLGLVGRQNQEQFKLVIDAELGYGKRGMPPYIMQDETLYFDMYIGALLWAPEHQPAETQAPPQKQE
jgi:FKBP-type peptidyl-prolyl cis-trans isomerase